jgi:hypothetical protein
MPEPAEKYLGVWRLIGGDKEADCGSGPTTTAYVDPHEVRFVEGESSDLTLQFFDGEDSTGPVVCEFEFDGKHATAELVREHSCSDGEVVTTWHASVASHGSWYDHLYFETEISDSRGCAGVLRPRYSHASR